MQEYYAMRDFLFPNGEKVFEKGHKYMGYRDGDCLMLISDFSDRGLIPRFFFCIRFLYI